MSPKEDIKPYKEMGKVILVNMRKSENLWVQYYLTPVCYDQ